MTYVPDTEKSGGEEDFLAITDDPRSEAEGDEPRTFVTFELAGQWLAVDVVNVREILDRQQVTPMPRAPVDVEGVIDVRGAAVTVMDLSHKLGLVASEESADSRIVVLEIPTKTGTRAIGIRADRVLEVSQISDASIETAAANSADWDRSLIEGITRFGDRIVVLLRLCEVFPANTTGSEGLGDDIFDFQ